MGISYQKKRQTPKRKTVKDLFPLGKMQMAVQNLSSAPPKNRLLTAERGAKKPKNWKFGTGWGG